MVAGKMGVVGSGPMTMAAMKKQYLKTIMIRYLGWESKRILSSGNRERQLMIEREMRFDTAPLSPIR